MTVARDQRRFKIRKAYISAGHLAFLDRVKSIRGLRSLRHDRPNGAVRPYLRGVLPLSPRKISLTEQRAIAK